jgi:MSHA biogenesis protein MshG
VEGRGFTEPLKATGLFPPMVTQMLAIGEESGELEVMCDKIVSYYELEVDNTIKNLVTLIEPFMVLILGMLVLILALGIFLPMWNLMEAYSKGA